MKTLFLAYFMAYMGSVIALFRPFVGICFFYAFVLIGPQYLFGSIVGVSYQWSHYLALGTVGGTMFLWIRSSFPNSSNRLEPEKTSKVGISILWNFLALVFVLFCSAWANPSQAGSIESASILLKIFIMVSVGCYLLDSPRRLKIFYWVLVLSQAFLTIRLNKWYFVDGFNSLILYDGYGSLNNNTFAMSLLPGVGLAVMGVIYNKPLLQKSIAFFAAISSMHVVLLSESRGAYLGLGVIMLVVAWYIPKNVKTILAFFFVGFIILSLAGKSVQEEFSTIFVQEKDRDVSAQSRFSLWEGAFDSILKHPLLGVGPNNFFILDDHGHKKVAHNLYLQTGAEAGIPALLLLVFLYFQVIRKSNHVLASHNRFILEKDPVLLWGAGGTVSGLLGYMTHSVFSGGLYIETPYLMILIGFAVFRLDGVQKEGMQNIRERERVQVPAVS